MGKLLRAVELLLLKETILYIKVRASGMPKENNKVTGVVK